MPVDRTLYEVLQVDPRAEPEVIEAAYRRLARMYHPDVSSHAGADRRMKEINAAYDVLGDPRRRTAYDRELAAAAATAAHAEPEGTDYWGPEYHAGDEALLGCREHAGAVAVGTCELCGAGLCVRCFERFRPPWCSACTLGWVSRRRSRVWWAIAWFFVVCGFVFLQVLRGLTGTPAAPPWLAILGGSAGYLVASYPSGLAALGGAEALDSYDAVFLLGCAAVVGPFVAPFRMIKLGFELRQLGRTALIARSDA
jgi:DnaJ domain